MVLRADTGGVGFDRAGFFPSRIDTQHPENDNTRPFPGEGRNDLEPVTCVLYPEVRKSLDWLRGYGDARMTGTGGASFLSVGDRQAGLDILNKAPPGCTGFVAQGLNRHPLIDETKFGV